MLYLETPIGVGFSYARDTSFYEGVNDKITGMSHQFDCKCYDISLLNHKLFKSVDFIFSNFTRVRGVD